MRVRREYLFAGAALGALAALVGVAVIVWAWLSPWSVVEERGASIVPDDLYRAFTTQLAAMLAGGVIGAAGLGVAYLCFRALSRDLDRLRSEIGIGRRREEG